MNTAHEGTNDPDLPPMTDEDRAAYGRHLAAAHEGLDSSYATLLLVGGHLLAVSERSLYREAYPSWEAFVGGEFDRSPNWAYNLVALARVHDVLVRHGQGPLTNEAQCRGVAPLLDDEAALVAVVARARETADAEGVRLTARHLSVARAEAEAAAHEEAGMPEEPADCAAVRAHEGLLVKVPVEGGELPEAVVAGLPGGALVPYVDGLVVTDASVRSADAAPFTPARVDDLTDQTWSVVVADPYSVAGSLALPDGPFRGTFFPERLSSPRSRPKADATERDRTVLVAPGVDLLHPDVPEAVARAVVEAAGADPGRRYILVTRHPHRTWKGWPPNVYVAVEAAGTAAAVAEAAGSLKGTPAPKALVVRDLAEPVGPGALAGVDWVLVRGPKTTQEAFDSVRGALSAGQALDVGRDVRVRYSGYPPLVAEEPVVEEPAIVQSIAPTLSEGTDASEDVAAGPIEAGPIETAPVEAGPADEHDDEPTPGPDRSAAGGPPLTGGTTDDASGDRARPSTAPDAGPAPRVARRSNGALVITELGGDA